jgi:hypothetical protein
MLVHWAFSGSIAGPFPPVRAAWTNRGAVLDTRRAGRSCGVVRLDADGLLDCLAGLLEPFAIREHVGQRSGAKAGRGQVDGMAGLPGCLLNFSCSTGTWPDGMGDRNCRGRWPRPAAPFRQIVSDPADTRGMRVRSVGSCEFRYLRMSSYRRPGWSTTRSSRAGEQTTPS